MPSDRNAPCPCGSGRKYKRCCLAREEAARPPERARVHAAHEELLEAILRFARRSLGLRSLTDILGDRPPTFMDELSLPFWTELALFHQPRPEQSLARTYLDAGFHVVQRDWLESRLTAWLTVLEALEPRPGQGLLALDALTGERLEILDVGASNSCQVRDMMLALVVHHEGETFLASGSPYLLAPREGHLALDAIRSALGLRGKRRADTALLRDFQSMLKVAILWSQTAEAWRSRPEPTLRNTDDEPMLPTIDHFEFASQSLEQLLGRIATMEWAQEPDERDDSVGFSFLRPGNALHASWDNTIIARVEVRPAGRLVVETNSVQRADLMRQRLERACGDLVRHRAREHSDIHSLMKRARAGAGTAPEQAEGGIPPEVKAQLIQEFKQRHFQDWPDSPLPALGGLTPRQAATGKPKARRQLEILFKEFEHAEAREPADHRFDMKRLRSELGLAD